MVAEKVLFTESLIYAVFSQGGKKKFSMKRSYIVIICHFFSSFMRKVEETELFYLNFYQKRIITGIFKEILS